MDNLDELKKEQAALSLEINNLTKIITEYDTTVTKLKNLASRIKGGENNIVQASSAISLGFNTDGISITGDKLEKLLDICGEYTNYIESTILTRIESDLSKHKAALSVLDAQKSRLDRQIANVVSSVGGVA